MELRQLRYVEAVARHRHFTRAAEELHVAQSALSHQVRRLEDELARSSTEPSADHHELGIEDVHERRDRGAERAADRRHRRGDRAPGDRCRGGLGGTAQRDRGPDRRRLHLFQGEQLTFRPVAP